MNADTDLPSPIPHPKKRHKRGARWIWLIPILATAYVVWLAMDHVQSMGPEITITFSQAGGIVPGKTLVKYKSVDVGTVTHMHLSEDLKTVEVTVRMDRLMEQHLSANTRFWVVRPQLSMREISGLETIVSGVYIAMDPVSTGQFFDSFQGLEKAPFLRTDEQGTRFLLSTEKLGSMGSGAPILYRGIQVGKVLGHDLDTDHDRVLLHVFVKSPHDQKIRSNTRFWNASGLDLSINADGFQLNTESMETLISGGIAFDAPSSLDTQASLKKGHIFPLYPNKESIEERIYEKKVRFVLFFDESVRGLQVGAPVEVRGLKVGKVLDVQMRFDPDIGHYPIAVLVEIEPERVLGGNTLPKDEKEWLDTMVNQGLRARLKTGSLITGQLLVDLDWYPGAAINLAAIESPYTEIPTLPTEIAEMTNAIKNILVTMQKLPLEDIGKELHGTLSGLNKQVNSRAVEKAIASVSSTMGHLEQLSAQVSREVPTATQGLNSSLKTLEATLEQAKRTMSIVESVVAPDAPLHDQTVETLKALTDAADSLSSLATALEKDPQSLLFGKNK
ncbi:PqiB family protein [Magnetococcus sp. PR-3]|uniref:PqiB family protein n=1 Tax=Magnetococcus sp. PR-3 TaxID=3120355 RepID=UPI002FCE2EEC